MDGGGDTSSVRKSGPVRSFGPESLRLRLRPVYLNYPTAKNRTGPVWTGPQWFFAVTQPVGTSFSWDQLATSPDRSFGNVFCVYYPTQVIKEERMYNGSLQVLETISCPS
jgi:hypothetical protein